MTLMNGDDVVDPFLAAIVAAEAEVEAAVQRRNDAVIAARKNRRSWEEIGRVLKVTKQSAWQRFRDLIEDDQLAVPARSPKARKRTVVRDVDRATTPRLVNYARRQA